MYLAFLTFSSWTGRHWLMILSKEFLYSSNSKILAMCFFPGFGWHWPMVPNAVIGTGVMYLSFLCFCISNFCPGVDMPGLWWALADGRGGSDGQQRFTPARPSFLLHLPRQTLACHAIGIFAHFYKYILQFGQIQFTTWANMFLSVVHWPGPPSPSLATPAYNFFNAFRQIHFATWGNISWSLDKYATSANIFCNVCLNSAGTRTFQRASLELLLQNGIFYDSDKHIAIWKNSEK